MDCLGFGVQKGVFNVSTPCVMTTISTLPNMLVLTHQAMTSHVKSLVSAPALPEWASFFLIFQSDLQASISVSGLISGPTRFPPDSVTPTRKGVGQKRNEFKSKHTEAPCLSARIPPAWTCSIPHTGSHSRSAYVDVHVHAHAIMAVDQAVSNRLGENRARI